MVSWGDDGAVGKVLALNTQEPELDPRAHVKKKNLGTVE